jgi:hypothetical protein
MEGGKTANYWPGFVDALTNVVIAMVFVIVVLAISLSFSAQMLAKRMAARVTQLEQEGKAKQAAAPVPSPEVVANRDAPAPIESPDSAVPGKVRIGVQGNEKHRSAAGGQVRAANRELVLEFAPTALTLDNAAEGLLVKSLGPVKKLLEAAPPGTRVMLVASGPEIEFSENQRSGYIRTMAVRNVLLDQGIPAERIGTRFDMKARPALALVSIQLEGVSP